MATVMVLGPAWWHLAIVMTLVGLVIPGRFLHRKFKQRQRTIQNGLPDALVRVFFSGAIVQGMR